MVSAAHLGARLTPFFVGIQVRMMSALLMVPQALGVMAVWGTRISFAAGALELTGLGLEGLDGWMSRAERTALTVNHRNVPTANNARGVYMETQVANVNLGGTIRGIDHYQDETIVQVKSRHFIGTPWEKRAGKLATSIRTDARQLSRFQFPTRGIDRWGSYLDFGGQIRQRVLITYVPDTYRSILLDPTLRARVLRASRDFNMAIRIVPVRGWRR